MRYQPSETPDYLRKQHPLQEAARSRIDTSRTALRGILSGEDQRLAIIMGPCSLDDAVLPNGTPAVIALAEQIAALSVEPVVKRGAQIIMRCPPAKPRTDVGWAGLEQTNLSRAHSLLTDIANMGMPLAIEVMHERHMARFGDMLTMAWVGARNVASTLLRHTVSAYDTTPTLFKNPVDGTLDEVSRAVKTVAVNQAAEIMDGSGRLVRLTSEGNRYTGLIVRGGASVQTPGDFSNMLRQADKHGLPWFVDCSHGNAAAHDDYGKKSVLGQRRCLDHLNQLMQAEPFTHIRGIMLETHLLEGADEATPGRSRTDPCISVTEASEKIMAFAAQRDTID